MSTYRSPFVSAFGYDVEFNLARLVAIEDALGKSASAVVIDIYGLGTDGKPVGSELDISRRISLKNMAGFVAACVGSTLEGVLAVTPPDELVPLFRELLAGFTRAVTLVNGGGKPEDPPKPASEAAG